ncbi:hypothetical protein E2C01_102158 [Portunus trituberculatus]|uniref:Uncharacterized protein n=1 Tax=Portunus trituberculatus TaxID=210409 RepID=A0A5B7KBU6_PORTR|nr:hypothetical protein [Portunus trituberculatus]
MTNWADDTLPRLVQPSSEAWCSEVQEGNGRGKEEEEDKDEEEEQGYDDDSEEEGEEKEEYKGIQRKSAL